MKTAKKPVMGRPRLESAGLTETINTCYLPSSVKHVRAVMKKHGIRSWSAAVRLCIECGWRGALKRKRI